MGVRHLAALGAGLLLAFAVARFPASAMDASIDAVANTGWNPPAATINVGDTVTWKNNTLYSHNVCVRRSNVASGCAEYRSNDPQPSSEWPTGGYTHAFASDGTYTFICQAHPSQMTGTITVGTGVNPPVDTGTGTSTVTGTTTTPPPYTQPTDTTTTPTQTQTSPTVADTTAPAFTGKVKRRSSRRALILQLGSSEDARLDVAVSRRPPRGRSFSRVGQAALHVNQGKNVVTVPRKARGSLRSGSYRVRLQLVDAAGNKSAPRTIKFKIA
jgi:plastocyanin